LLATVAVKERDRLRVRRVDVASHARLVRRFDVEQVPCLVLVAERKVAGRIDGRANMTQIELLLEQHLAETVPPA
jgi:thioredoxin-like negative regulator of GroEL